jgi:hypothetical protein
MLGSGSRGLMKSNEEETTETINLGHVVRDMDI